jgi:hypothetical protein
MFEDGTPPMLEMAIKTLHGASDPEFHYGSIFSGDGRHKNLNTEYFRRLFMNPTTCVWDIIPPDVYAHRIPTPSSLSEVDFKLPFHFRNGGTLIPDRSVPGNPPFQEVVYTTREQLTAAQTNDISATKIAIHDYHQIGVRIFVSRIFEISSEIFGVVIAYSYNNHYEIFYIFVLIMNSPGYSRTMPNIPWIIPGYSAVKNPGSVWS